MFVNPAYADLHLRASATNAIDKASTLSTVTNDFDGGARPRGANPDIGADEFTTNASPMITNIAVSGTDFVLTFTTAPGLSYDVQRANEVTGVWSVVTSNITGTGGVLQDIDTNGAFEARWFYRVKWSP